MILKYYDGSAYIELTVLDEISIKKSNREVNYSSLKVDFTGYTIDDLPIKLQEVQVIDNGTTLFYGYIDEIKLPKYDKTEVLPHLEFTLLSPLAMLTKRSVTITGKYSISDLFDLVFAPLYADGFTLTEFNVTLENEIEIPFILQSIEYVTNYLSNRFGLFVYVDQLKQITVNSINYQFGLAEVENLTSANYKDLDDIWSLEPSIKSVDYANIINIKNALVYTTSNSTNIGITVESEKPAFEVPKIIKSGEIINFYYPFDISQNTLVKIAEEEDITYAYGFQIRGYVGVDFYSASILYDTTTSLYTISDVSFEEDATELDFVLIRDQFFKNLVTGVKFTGTGNLEVDKIYSNTALVPYVSRLINNQEILANQGKISTTGQVEKIVDVKGKWFSKSDIVNYARSLLQENTNQSDVAKLSFKGTDLETYNIGDKFIINIEELFINDTFVVTDTNYRIKNNIEELNLTLRTANVLENYIDLFRRDLSQDNEEQTNNILTSPFVEENITVSHEVEII